MCKGVEQIMLAWATLVAVSTTEVFVPAGGWQSAGNVTSGRAYGELRGKTGNFQVKFAVQLANDVRSPASATAISAALTADGVSDPSSFTSLSTGGAKYIRPGYLVSLTSGSTFAGGAVAGVIELVYGT